MQLGDGDVGVKYIGRLSLKNTDERNENLINHPLPTVVVCPRDAHEDSRSVMRN